MGFRIVVFRQLVFYMFALYFYFAIFCGLIFSTFIMPQLSIGDKSAAVELRKVGLTNRKITKQLNFHPSALEKSFRRYDETESTNRAAIRFRETTKIHRTSRRHAGESFAQRQKSVST